MSELVRPRMSSAEFLAWAMQNPPGERYELVAGEVIAMAPERSSHALTKGRVFRRLAEAIEAADLPCTVYPDGMAVVIDDATTYDRAFRRLALSTVDSLMTPSNGAPGPTIAPGTNLREALSTLLTAQAEIARIAAPDGAIIGQITRAQILAL